MKDDVLLQILLKAFHCMGSMGEQLGLLLLSQKRDLLPLRCCCPAGLAKCLSLH